MPVPEQHLFICTYTRASGDKPSCGRNKDCDANALRQSLKNQVKDLWSKRVKVTTSGCLGHCSEGVCAVLYPQGEWYFNLQANDQKKLIEDMEERLV